MPIGSDSIRAGASGVTSGYEIDYSCVFNDDDDSYISRTYGTGGNQDLWTLSFWIKRTEIGTGGDDVETYIFVSGADATNSTVIMLHPTDVLKVWDYTGSYNTNLITTQVFRDVSAWYHFVIVYDSAQVTAADRVTIYVNGSEITDFSTATYPDQNEDSILGSNVALGFGRYISYGAVPGDYYLAEINYANGTAEAVTAFGETNDDGVWIPKKYGGSYGTGGFYLDFADSSALGNDVSGNNNDFTSSGLATNDQVPDTPTNNYCILNSLDAHIESACVLSNGNLQWKNTNTAKANDVRATFAVSSGKWYWECELDTLGQSGVNREFVGIVSPEWLLTSGTDGTSFPSDSTGYAIATKGDKINSGSTVSYGSAMSAGDIVGVALDLDNGKIWFSINGTYPSSGDPAAGSNEAYSSLSGLFAPAFAADYGTGNSTLIANFGQSSFNTAAPTNFLALNTSNLAAPAIKDPSAHFQTTLYTGNATGSRAITQGASSQFGPDLVWIKNRDQTDEWKVLDTTRGATKEWSLDSDADESTDANGLTAFSATDGFTLGTGAGGYNDNAEDFVAYQWEKGATPGFDIVQYTGNASNRTVAHSLGAVPDFYIVKDLGRTSGLTEPGTVYHGSNTSAPETEYLTIATHAATNDYPYWNDTAPTSSVFSLGTSSTINGSGEIYIAYLFAAVEGFSAFGSYTGNGDADGPFVHCGFKPRFIIVKGTDQAANWEILDTARDTYNVAHKNLRGDNSNVEDDSRNQLDFLSNGFKLRTTYSNHNGSGNDYIFMAFAENPFGGSGVAPATAR